MGMVGTVRPELVRGTESQAVEFIMEGILIGEESRERWLMVSSNGVVVAEHKQPVAVRSGQLLDALQQRGNEALLSGNLLGTAVARGHINAEDGELRLGIENDATRPGWDADRKWLKRAGNGQPRREKHAALAAFVTGERQVTIGSETCTDQLGAGAVIGLAEDDQIVLAPSQPAQYPLSARLCSDRDIEGENTQLPSGAMAAPGAGRATGIARRPSFEAGGRHRVSKGCGRRLGPGFAAAAHTPPLDSQWR
jgi:hypothetical protein